MSTPTKRYPVRILCRTGTTRLISGAAYTYWEDILHEITWCVEDTLEAASKVADELRAGDPAKRELKQVWVDFL